VNFKDAQRFVKDFGSRPFQYDPVTIVTSYAEKVQTAAARLRGQRTSVSAETQRAIDNALEVLDELHTHLGTYLTNRRT
jgi:hypothetical protein